MRSYQAFKNIHYSYEILGKHFGTSFKTIDHGFAPKSSRDSGNGGPYYEFPLQL